MLQVTQLPNGVRVVTNAMPQMESVSVGFWIGIGGRYEPARVCGIAHFLEHLLFKGTHRRSARQISQAVESVGGYINAFTGEESTCYYAKASHRHRDILFDVLADMYLHPKIAAADCTKERSVIKDELQMYRDQPEHYVHELLNETIWPDHPLGRALTGTPQSLDAIRRADLVAFNRGTYLGANTVVAVAGHCEHGDVVARLGPLLTEARPGRSPKFVVARERQHGPRLRFMTKAVEQSHVALGIRGYSRHDPRRFAMKLMSVMLGENMSSRLFQVIRERHGLAYSIQSSTSYFDDTGALLISAGLDTRWLPRVLGLIMRELGRLAARPPASGELRAAKDYAIGQMRLSLESTSSQMMWAGEHLLAYGFVPSPKDVEQQIEGITAQSIHAVAAAIFRDNRLNAAVITPDNDERRVRGLLRF